MVNVQNFGVLMSFGQRAISKHLTTFLSNSSCTFWGQHCIFLSFFVPSASCQQQSRSILARDMHRNSQFSYVSTCFWMTHPPLFCFTNCPGPRRGRGGCSLEAVLLCCFQTYAVSWRSNVRVPSCFKLQIVYVFHYFFQKAFLSSLVVQPAMHAELNKRSLVRIFYYM